MTGNDRSRQDHPFDRLAGELEAAAARQVAAAGASPGRRPQSLSGRLRRRRLAVAATLAAGSTVGAAAWAASALFSTGSPVPFAKGAPIAGRAMGAPVPGTVKLLVDDVPDPAGGPPWGLRYWETDRKYGCLQVGRVYEGRLGQITGGRAFHELRIGVARNGLGGCYVLDGSNHAFVAIHADAYAGAVPRGCDDDFLVGALTRRRPVRPACTRALRTVDFGLLGPNATGYRARVNGRIRAAEPLGDVGAYLVVQRRLRPVIKEFGFHHRDPKLNLRGQAEPYLALTPASQVIREVTYRNGTCTVRVTGDQRGACERLAGYVPIPQPSVADVRAPIRAFPAPGGRGIRVRFRAREAVVDGRTGYDIEVRPVGGRFGLLTQTYSRNVEAGDMVRITVGRYNGRRGPYRIVVRFRSVPPRPGPFATLAFPGLLVGQARVVVP